MQFLLVNFSFCAGTESCIIWAIGSLMSNKHSKALCTMWNWQIKWRENAIFTELVQAQAIAIERTDVSKQFTRLDAVEKCAKQKRNILWFIAFKCWRSFDSTISSWVVDLMSNWRMSQVYTHLNAPITHFSDAYERRFIVTDVLSVNRMCIVAAVHIIRLAISPNLIFVRSTSDQYS